MYVKKFEGETLDEALKAVKSELGPDAIILKTVTNKGLKGAFRKSRIEITAAISEQSYAKKSRVDHVLNEDQKAQFYNAPAEKISQSIADYNDHRPKTTSAAPANYGNMGLNKVVRTVSKASDRIKSSLDDFLAVDEEPHAQEYMSSANLDAFLDDHLPQAMPEVNEVEQQLQYQEPQNNGLRAQEARDEATDELRQQVKSQYHKIDLLEQKLFELTQKLTDKGTEDSSPRGIKDLRNTLRAMDLSEAIIQKIIKKASFELSKEELEDSDLLDDLALRELNEMIRVEMPLFSQADIQEKPVVTALISENSCGQSSMALKLAVLQENVKIIRFRENAVDNVDSDFIAQVFKLDMTTVNTLSHLMSEARKAIQEGTSLILDLRFSFKESNESKKFIETLKRSFEQIEFLTTVSAIQSEIYNRKIISKYKPFSSGVIISYVDQCLSFGSLLNVHYEHNEQPLKFFGTGPTVPDDIEAATAERLLAAMFKL